MCIVSVVIGIIAGGCDPVMGEGEYVANSGGCASAGGCDNVC